MGSPVTWTFTPVGTSTQSRWFILSVLFLKGSEMFMVPTRVQDPMSHRPPPWSECLPDQLVYSVCFVFDRWWTSHRPLPWYECLLDQLVHSVCVVFDRQREGRWSLQGVRDPHHTDIHPSRNVSLTSWFILSVLFLTGGETSVVPTYVQDTRDTDLYPGRNIYLTCWFILSVFFLRGSEMTVVLTGVRDPHHTDLNQNRNVSLTCCFILSVMFFHRQWVIGGPYTCPESPVTQTSTVVGTSTWPAGSFCLCYFWQSVRHHTDLYLGRNVYLTRWFILSLLFLRGSEMFVVPTRVQDPIAHILPPW